MAKDPTLEETLDGFLHHRTPGSIVSFVEVGISLLELFPVVFETLGVTRDPCPHAIDLPPVGSLLDLVSGGALSGNETGKRVYLENP